MSETKEKTISKAHTPTPWEVTPTLGKLAITRPHKKIGIAFDSICHMDSNIDDGIGPEANAAFIVEAVNSYEKLKRDNEALLEAAKDALEFIRNIRENVDEEKPDMPYESEDALDLAIAQAEVK